MVSMDIHEHQDSLVHTNSESSVSTNIDVSESTSNCDCFKEIVALKLIRLQRIHVFLKLNNFGNLNFKNMRLSILNLKERQV